MDNEFWLTLANPLLFSAEELAKIAKILTGVSQNMNGLPEKTPHGSWVQTERAAHEAWASLVAKAPKAAQLMHLLTARVHENNAVVISHKTLADLMKVKSITTVKTALSVLQEDRWIEIRQIGDRGTVNAYILNDRVAWSGARDGRRYSLFSATVVLSSEEQPDRDSLGQQAALRSIPGLLPGERQLPAGDGLPPPSEPALPGMEHDLPATQLPYDPDTGELFNYQNYKLDK